MDVNVENFLSNIVSKEISFAKENLIDYRTENGYCFGFYEGSVEFLHNRKVFINEFTRVQGHKRYKNEIFLLVITFQNSHERKL